MKRLIEFLIEGCFHKWEVVSKYEYSSNWEGTGTSVGQSRSKEGVLYVLRCSRCGKMKNFRNLDA
jgi:hypothetical protein